MECIIWMKVYRDPFLKMFFDPGGDWDWVGGIDPPKILDIENEQYFDWNLIHKKFDPPKILGVWSNF